MPYKLKKYLSNFLYPKINTSFQINSDVIEADALKKWNIFISDNYIIIRQKLISQFLFSGEYKLNNNSYTGKGQFELDTSVKLFSFMLYLISFLWIFGLSYTWLHLFIIGNVSNVSLYLIKMIGLGFIVFAVNYVYLRWIFYYHYFTFPKEILNDHK